MKRRSFFNALSILTVAPVIPIPEPKAKCYLNVEYTQQDIEYWRQVFEEAQYDKDFKVFTHDVSRV